jgi:hypothetical protein
VSAVGGQALNWSVAEVGAEQARGRTHTAPVGQPSSARRCRGERLARSAPVNSASRHPAAVRGADRERRAPLASLAGTDVAHITYLAYLAQEGMAMWATCDM